MRPAAVRIDRLSSSFVVAPSASAEIVRVATRIGSTPSSPSDARAMAWTILFRSTASSWPLRFITRMPPPGAPPLASAWPTGADLAASVNVGARNSPVSSAVAWFPTLPSISVTGRSVSSSSAFVVFRRYLLRISRPILHSLTGSLICRPGAKGTRCRGSRFRKGHTDTTCRGDE